MEPPPYDDKNPPPPPYPGQDPGSKNVGTFNPPPPPPWQPRNDPMVQNSITESYRPLPVSIAQQPQRHVNVVVVEGGGGGGLHQASFVGEPIVADSYLTHVALACTVMWCCSCPFGLIAYVLASMAQSAAVLDRARAQRLARASLKVSFVGIILTVIVGAIVGGVCRGHGGCVSRSRGLLPPSPFSNCSKYELRGVCYGERRRLSFLGQLTCDKQRTFDACCYQHEDVYDNKYCYTLDVRQRDASVNSRPQQQQQQQLESKSFLSKKEPSLDLAPEPSTAPTATTTTPVSSSLEVRQER